MNSLKNKTSFLPLTLCGNDQTERPVADQRIAGRGADMSYKREPGVSTTPNDESGSEHSC